MKEGTIGIVTEFPSPWPPAKKTTIAHESAMETELLLIGDSEGRLRFEVNNTAFTSQPIEFTKAHRALLLITWNNKKDPAISIRINSIDLSDSSTKSPLQVESKDKLTENTLSFQYPEAPEACLEWTDWRKHRYSTQKVHPKENRDLKSIDSQFEELLASIQSLEHFVESFSDKPSLFVPNTLPHLRALLFWPDGKAKNYNPLLFRMSGHIGIPLPVFAFKDRIKDVLDDELYSDAVVHRVFNPPSLIREYPNQKMIDFQEWLNMSVISDKSSTERKVYRWKDIIFDAANTISASHYDDDIPKFIKNLQGVVCWDHQLFLGYITALTSATITLGKYTISNFKNQA